MFSPNLVKRFVRTGVDFCEKQNTWHSHIDFNAHGPTYVPIVARAVGSCSMVTFYLSVEIGRQEAKCEIVSKSGPGTEITAVEGYALVEQTPPRRQVFHDLEVFRYSLALGGSENFIPSCANLSSFSPLSNFEVIPVDGCQML